MQGRIFCRKCSVPACGRAHCVEGLGRYGAPDVFNADQGRQSMSRAFDDALKAHSVRTAMHDKGRYMHMTASAQHQAARDAQAGEQDGSRRKGIVA